MPLECKRRPSVSGPKRRKVFLAESVRQMFSITVNYAGPVDTSDGCGTFGVKVGLFNGMESLAPPLTTSVVMESNEFCYWEQSLVFDIQIRNLPQMSRLCFMLYEVSSSKSGNRMNPVSWVNTTVYNYMNNLKSGSSNLPMWPCKNVNVMVPQLNPSGREPFNPNPTVALNPNRTVALNPDTEESVSLTVTFDPVIQAGDIPVSFSPSTHLNGILFPQTETDYLSMGDVTLSEEMNGDEGKGRRDMNGDEGKGRRDTNGDEGKGRKGSVSKIHLEQLREVCSKIPVTEVSEQDKELFRLLRTSCSTLLPHSLPYVLMSVKWNDKWDVREMMNLLEEWPPIRPETALCLLSSVFSALEVRAFAVHSLVSFSDEDLILFLPQLVQALKNESFLFNNLAQFLVKRSLSNQLVGHHFFWLLKAEMSDPELLFYFGLILEAYCRGAPQHMMLLIKQVDSLTQMKRVNDLVRSDASRRNDSREKLREFLHDMLSKNVVINSFTDTVCPFNPRLNLNKVKIEKCKFMDSKMKPLFMTFSNRDVGAEDVSLIFKVGDDLRQDMLILQMIRIMDRVWKEEGLDLRLCPYRVLSTGEKVGVIEVVKKASTIANIQKEAGSKATSAFKKGSLYNWLKSHSTDGDSFKTAVDQFTLSCAGYSVATYVLGIADRHSDNIMVKSDGQLFHIDFGHILGKFKEKFGIRRERVPFVLTHDFVYVIKRGDNDQGNFKKFRNLCESAFMAIRKRGPFIMSIFQLMLATGIPEIADESDLDYLKDTLVLDLSDSEALENFRSKFKEAEKNSWKTSLNWFAHNVSKDNK